MDQLPELKQLIHNCIMDKFDLSYLERFRELQSKNQNDDAIRLESQYQIGFIYAFNEMHQEAAKVFLPLLEERENIEDFQFSNLLISLLKSLTKVNQLDLATTIFDRFIDDPCNDGFYQIEAMLDWLVTATNPTEPELLPYKSKLGKLMTELGYSPAKGTMKEKIIDIRAVHQRSNHQFSTICISHQKEPKNQTIQKLDDFISSNPPKYYRKMAEDFKSKLKAG